MTRRPRGAAGVRARFEITLEEKRARDPQERARATLKGGGRECRALGPHPRPRV